MIKQIKIINKTKFVLMVLNIDDETFVVYIIAIVESAIMAIYSFCKT